MGTFITYKTKDSRGIHGVRSTQCFLQVTGLLGNLGGSDVKHQSPSLSMQEN